MKATSALFLILPFLVVPAAVQAQFFYMTNNGAITLAMYAGPGGDVVISNFVSSIGSSVFNNCDGLTSVVIPASVTNIGTEAFANCPKLKNAAIAGGVVSIGDNAFYSCASLVGITLPGSVTNIGNFVFMNCISLTSATISGGVTSLAPYMFYGCTNLGAVYFQGSPPPRIRLLCSHPTATPWPTTCPGPPAGWTFAGLSNRADAGADRRLREWRRTFFGHPAYVSNGGTFPRTKPDNQTTARRTLLWAAPAKASHQNPSLLSHPSPPRLLTTEPSPGDRGTHAIS